MLLLRYYCVCRKIFHRGTLRKPYGGKADADGCSTPYSPEQGPGA